MSDRPYTDADLRAEAARQHALSTEDPDFMGIAERMEGSKIPSRGDVQWDQLADHDFDTAQRTIDDLLTSAADVSAWAVNLGADGLKPDERSLDTAIGDEPRLRIHFAFHPEISDEDRDRFVQHIAVAVITAD